MKGTHAIGFCIIGFVMLWLPAVAPRLCPVNPAFGTSTRELWLLFMGTVNAGIGGAWLGWQAMRQAWQIPGWLEPRQAPEPVVLGAPSRAGV